MKKTVFVILAMLLLCPVLALAQASTPGPGGPHPAPRPAAEDLHHAGGPELGAWWKNSEIVAQLQLSDAQIKQIEDTFLEHRLKLIDLHADVERQEAKLQPLVEADQPDEAKVSAQVELLVAARGRLEKANIMMMLAIRKQLTVEQWKKLQTLQQQREQMRRRGFGGPGERQGTPRPPEAPTPEANE